MPVALRLNSAPDNFEQIGPIGRNFVRMIGHPAVMRLSVKYGIPRPMLMRFALRVMANLTDGRDGVFEDKVMHGLLSLVSER